MNKFSQLFLIILLVYNNAMAHPPIECNKGHTLSTNNYNQAYNPFYNNSYGYNRANNLMTEFDKFFAKDFYNFANKTTKQDKKYFDKRTDSYIAEIFLGIDNIDSSAINISTNNNYITININTSIKYKSDNINSYQSNYSSNSFSIPSDANISKLTKIYDNKTGVLTIVMPRK